MYVGRFVVVGPEVAAYRVSSRSFPNRRVVEREDALTVAPTPDAPETDNPYVSYNCYREAAGHAVVGNGSHVDPIAEKLGLGYPRGTPSPRACSHSTTRRTTTTRPASREF